MWVDDLILLVLDADSLQKLLNCLHDYAEKWELSVNIIKTSVMVFNTSSRILKCALVSDVIGANNHKSRSILGSGSLHVT